MPLRPATRSFSTDSTMPPVLTDNDTLSLKSANIVAASIETATLPASPTSFLYDDDDVTLRNVHHHAVRQTSSIRTSTSSRTYAPSVALSRSDSSVSKHKFNSTTALEDPASPDVPSRMDLNAAIGTDMVPRTVELTSLPCAGIRISHGRLAGLMAWRFVVQLPRNATTSQSISPFRDDLTAVITNFILDTGSLRSLVPPETLLALGYTGPLTTGLEVKLVVQGVLVNFKVAPRGDAGRLSMQFMVAASLALYFDQRLVAPVLYFADNDSRIPRTQDIPSTVPSPPPVTLKQLIMSLMNFGRRAHDY